MLFEVIWCDLFRFKVVRLGFRSGVVYMVLGVAIPSFCFCGLGRSNLLRQPQGTNAAVRPFVVVFSVLATRIATPWRRMEHLPHPASRPNRLRFAHTHLTASNGQIIPPFLPPSAGGVPFMKAFMAPKSSVVWDAVPLNYLD